MSLVIEEIGDGAELERLAPEWRALWERCGEATPFTHPAWLIAWWRAFQPGRLMALAARSGGRLVGLAPLYIEDGRLGRRALPVGVSVSDYFDLLLDPREQAAPQALADALHERADRWDAVSLEELPPGAAALAMPAPAGCEDAVAPQSACPVLAAPGPADDLRAAVPARKRRKLRMARHRMRRRGGLAVEPIAAGQADGFLEALLALHAARWSERGEPGVLADEAVRRFHRAALPALIEAGLSQCLALRCEGRIVGAHYGMRDRRRAYAYLGGFDPGFAHESPGTVLMGEAIEEAARHGLREMHLLRGSEAYKYQWGAVDRWNSRRVLARRGP